MELANRAQPAQVAQAAYVPSLPTHCHTRVFLMKQVMSFALLIDMRVFYRTNKKTSEILIDCTQSTRQKKKAPSGLCGQSAKKSCMIAQGDLVMTSQELLNR